MNPREKFLNTINGRNFEIPIFCPAIYGYKVNFSNLPQHLFGQHEFEVLDAITNEINWLRSEVVTCSYDIYNVEAEAVGSRVVRQQDIFPDIATPLISNFDEIDALPIVTGPAGRMALFVNATKYLSRKYQNRIYIRGAVSGPFSLAGKIYPQDRLITDCVLNPKGVSRLMAYCTDLILTYIDAFLTAGQDVVVFDSLAIPLLVSPEMYGDLILPFHQKIFGYMKEQGVRIRPLIMGGDTRLIMDHLVRTGANQLLLDYVIPLNDMVEILDRHNMAFQVNIHPALVAQKDQDIIAGELKMLLGDLGIRSDVLIGTGILLQSTPLKNIQFVQDYIKTHYGSV